MFRTLKASIILIAVVLGLAACGAPAGTTQSNPNTEVALRALIAGCSQHEGVQSYSFRYQSTKYLWTAICEDNQIVIVGGD